MKYLAHYSEDLQDQVRELLAAGRLGEVLAKRYPDRHEIQSNAALYDYVMARKREHMSSAGPLHKVGWCDKIATLHDALGTHTYATRVQGGRLKTKHELRVASIFKQGPPEFLEMIVVHELAHLREREHNKAFFRLCQHMLPDYFQIEFDMRMWLTWLEAEARLTPETIVVLPLGAAAKEHGPHLRLDNDLTLAEYFKARILVEAEVVVLPTLPYHYYPAFTEYPGSTTLRFETARDVVVDIVRSIAAYGPRRFYVANTGVSTKRPLQAASEQLAAEGIVLHFTDLIASIGPVEKAVAEQPGGTHADEIETSMILYMAPDKVDMRAAVRDYHPRGKRGYLSRDPNTEETYSKTGIWGDPTLATRAKGRARGRSAGRRDAGGHRAAARGAGASTHALGGQRSLDPRERFEDRRSIVMPIGHQPNVPRRSAARDHPKRREPLQECIGAHARARVIDIDHVGLHGVEVDRNPAAHGGQPLGEQARVRMILGEPGDHGLERDDTHRRDHPGLPHTPTEPPANVPRLLDEFDLAGQHRAERAAQALAEREHDRVDVASIFVHARARRDRGVEDPRPVEVDRQAALARERAQFPVQRERHNPTTAAIVRVLEAEQARPRIVNVRPTDRRSDPLGIQHSPLARNRHRHQVRDAGERADLVMENVRLRVEDHLVARLSVDHQRDQVGHVAADRQHRRRLAHRGGGEGLEAQDRWVLAVGVVAERCGGEGLEHRGGREGLGVAAEVDRLHGDGFGGGWHGPRVRKSPLCSGRRNLVEIRPVDEQLAAMQILVAVCIDAPLVNPSSSHATPGSASGATLWSFSKIDSQVTQSWGSSGR
ncbi:MAG: creatininase family protein [Deltaproteobacteria bacterium]|nr:creatininase family protein [Deltaproteobacteria bacterium]